MGDYAADFLVIKKHKRVPACPGHRSGMASFAIVTARNEKEAHTTVKKINNQHKVDSRKTCAGNYR